MGREEEFYLAVPLSEIEAYVNWIFADEKPRWSQPAIGPASSNKNAMSNMAYSLYHSSPGARLPSLVRPVQGVVAWLQHHGGYRVVKEVLVAGCNRGAIY
jgi:hypothetical protein